MPEREPLGERLRRENEEREQARTRAWKESEACEAFLLDDFHQQVLDYLAFPDEWLEGHPDRVQ